MEIQREAYLNQLIERRDNGMIKIVTGIRRCGKSYLLFKVMVYGYQCGIYSRRKKRASIE